MTVARAMAAAAADALGVKPSEVLIASTGVIGVLLDIARLKGVDWLEAGYVITRTKS